MYAKLLVNEKYVTEKTGKISQKWRIFAGAMHSTIVTCPFPQYPVHR